MLCKNVAYITGELGRIVALRMLSEFDPQCLNQETRTGRVDLTPVRRRRVTWVQRIVNGNLVRSLTLFLNPSFWIFILIIVAIYSLYSLYVSVEGHIKNFMLGVGRFLKFIHLFKSVKV